MKNLYIGSALISALIFASCGKTVSKSDTALDTSSYQEKLLTQLIDAKPGDVIDVPEGTYNFDRSLSLTVDGVTLRGAGMDKTVLSFKRQVSGAEGLLVTASNFTIEDIAIEDTVGDAIKVNEGDNIVFRNVRTEWTNGPDTKWGLWALSSSNNKCSH